MSLSPARLGLTGRPGQADPIRCGDDWSHGITCTENGVPVDKSGSTFLAQIRHRADADDVLATLSVLVSGVDSNVLTLSLTNTETEALRPYIGTDGVWDLEETDSGGIVTTRLEGPVEIVSDVSRAP